MDICHSPESGTPGAPLRPKSSTPRSGFVQPGVRDKLVPRLRWEQGALRAAGSALSHFWDKRQHVGRCLGIRDKFVLAAREQMALLASRSALHAF